MQMSDRRRIPASREAVWTALNDPDVLKRCIPGCESLEMTSPTEMTAAVVLRVGPVKAKFGGKVTLSDLDPPNGYRIAGEGSGGVAGFAKGGASIRLEAEAAEITLLHYEVDAQIGGKLAQLGGRLIDSTAQKLAGEFFETFAGIVAPPSDTGAEQPGQDGQPESGKGWLKGLFSKPGAATALVALCAAATLTVHACCLSPAPAQARTPNDIPICRTAAIV